MIDFTCTKVRAAFCSKHSA